MGTPLLWWSATICIFVTVGYYIYQREKSALLILIGLGANYLPWFFFQKRTMFYFYSIAFEPFLILCVVYVMSKARERNRLIYGSLALIALVFLYFLPLFMGLTLPYDSWYDRMWLPSWI